MATQTGFLNALIRVLNVSNIIDFELPIYLSQSFTNGYSLKQNIASTSAVVITLPCTSILFVYLKAVVGTLTVTWTPATGASAVVQDIAVGGILIMDNPSGGITALTLGKTAVNCTYDMLIGG